MSVVWEDVRAAAAADARVIVLDDAVARNLVERVRQTFIADPTARWWWESLRGSTVWLHYDDAMGGLEVLRARIESQPMVNLLVTDEQTEPYGVVAGSGEAILDLLRETPIFEFALTDPDARWLIVDTHHNDLALVGDVPTG